MSRSIINRIIISLFTLTTLLLCACSNDSAAIKRNDTISVERNEATGYTLLGISPDLEDIRLNSFFREVPEIIMLPESVKLYPGESVQTLMEMLNKDTSTEAIDQSSTMNSISFKGIFVDNVVHIKLQLDNTGKNIEAIQMDVYPGIPVDGDVDKVTPTKEDYLQAIYNIKMVLIDRLGKPTTETLQFETMDDLRSVTFHGLFNGFAWETKQGGLSFTVAAQEDGSLYMMNVYLAMS